MNAFYETLEAQGIARKDAKRMIRYGFITLVFSWLGAILGIKAIVNAVRRHH